MNRKPLIFNLAALACLGVILSFPLQIMLLFDQSPAQWPNIIDKITPLNALTMALFGANALLLWRASPQLKWSLPLLILVCGHNNLLVAQLGSDYSWGETSLATLALVAGASLLALPRPRRVLLHPELRWWLSPPRLPLQHSIQLQLEGGITLEAKTLNISQNGVFMTFDNLFIPVAGTRHVKRPLSLKEGQRLCPRGKRVSLCIIKNHKAYSYPAQIVRHGPGGSGEDLGLALRYRAPWWQRLGLNPLLRPT